MKLRGLTKLALSGVALAAVAATLGTSTYAWYVSNTTATVSGAQGTTAGAATVGSLYAATNEMKEAGNWSNNITLAEGTDYTSNALMPATKITSDKTTAYNKGLKYADSNASTFTPSSSTGFVDKAGAELTVAKGAYLEFSYWLVSRGGNNVKVTPSLTISNTTTDFTDATKQKAYSGSNLPGTSLATGSLFKVDAVHALRVEITNSQVVADSSASASTAASTQTTYLADRDFEAYSSPSNFTAPGSGDANLYYNSIVNGVNLYGCGQLSDKNCCVSEVEGATTKWGTFWLAPETPTKLTFKVWLEGTDKDCFDSCVGQKFRFDFKFTL